MEESTPSHKEQLKFLEDYSPLFRWEEYLVFGAVLAISATIGICNGCRGSKSTSGEEFLMGGRKMGVLPVTLSLICSFISAITLLGEPVEVYFYGLVYIFFSFGFLPMTLALVYLYLPVFFELQLTSAYEYFELRFNRNARLVISATAVLHLMIYMPLTVWAPCLALDQVAGLNKYITSVVIFLVCIVYSSIGGLKGVLWTDAFQSLVMFGTMITVIIIGVKEVGGLDVVWERAKDSGRTNIINLDPDPRTRHTIWTGLIAAYFSWIPMFAGTQAQIQRYLSVPTLQDARKCLFFNFIGLFVLLILCALTGLTIFATFYDCDPVSFDGKIVSSSDQLLPLFVMHVMSDYPGIPGLLVAGLVCGCLSTVSSALNALPAIIIEDFVKRYKPLSDREVGILSKIISAVGGLLSFSLIFVVANAGDILPFASLLHGAFLGPIVGVFSLGMFFPFANVVGSITGILPAVGMTLLIGIGSIIEGNEGLLPNQKLPFGDEGCYLNHSAPYLASTFTIAADLKGSWKDEDYSVLTKIFSVAYLWQPAIPVIFTVIFGIIFSLLYEAVTKKRRKSNTRYFNQSVLSLWVRLLGRKRIESWVDFDDKVKRNSGK